MAFYFLRIAGQDYAFVTTPNDTDQCYHARLLSLRRLLRDLVAQQDAGYVEVVLDERYTCSEAVEATFKTRIAGKLVDIHCISVPNLQETHIPERRYMPFPFMSITVNN